MPWTLEYKAADMSGTKGKEVEKSKSGETPAKRRRVDGEQPKASAEGEGFGKQETIAEEGHGDWRSPLFYWRGVLAVVKGKGKKNGFVTWKGAWVSSVSGLPPDKEFETSLNDFQLQMEQDTCVLDALLNGEPTASVFARDRLKGKFKGHYLLDQEDGRGLKKYKVRTAFCRLCKILGENTRVSRVMRCSSLDQRF